MPESAPIGGLPDFLGHILWSWFYAHGLRTGSGSIAVTTSLDDLALALKMDLGPRERVDARIKRLQGLLWADRGLFLKAIDWAVGSTQYASDKDELSTILQKAGSIWTLAPDREGLSRRVLPEAQAAAAQVVEGGTREGVLIGQAWRHIYGREPNPTAGFDKSVRAVEAVACPAIIPNDRDATLGRAIGTLKNRPPGKFGSVFRNARNMDPLDGVVGLMELLWTNNYARHASDPDVPVDVSQPEAEAALHAAVTLVQWFQRRFVGQEPL
jgi:hypothetical protein